MSKKILFLSLMLLSFLGQAKTHLCHQLGGEIKILEARFATHQGIMVGFKRHFCELRIDNGILNIGLTTLESKKPNLAASLVKTLQTIDDNSPLFAGPYSNPSHNVCKNLGGSFIQMLAYGSFSDNSGDYDICVFGDGSMISSWSLIYIANNRQGYDIVKNSIPSATLPLSLLENR